MPNIVRQFSKNVFSSWVSLAVRVVLVFLVNPFIIHTLGNSLYGAWMLVFSIINYLTIFDLGLKQAVVRFVSKFLGLKDFNKINSVLNTSFAVYSLIGIATIGVSLIVSYLVLDKFNIPPDILSQAQLVLLIIGVNVAVNFIMSAWADSLGAFHRFDVVNGLLIAEDILRNVTIVYLLLNGYGIVSMALSFLGFSILRQIIGAIALKRLFPEIKFSIRFVNRETMKMLYNYGLIGFFISIAWLLIANTDNVIIGYFFDTSAVAKYAIAGSIIIYLRNLILAVAFPLRPVISHYDALGRRENISIIYSKGTKYLYFITFVIGGAAIFLADDFIKLWLGPGYQQTADILKILVLPAALYLPQTIANSVLYGIEKHRNILYLIIVEGVLNLGISLILLKEYGIYGVAFGTVIPQVLLYLIVMPKIVQKLLGFGLVEFYKSTFISIFSALIVSAGSAYILQRILDINNWPVFFLVVALIAAISLTAGYLIADSDDIKRIFKGTSSRNIE